MSSAREWARARRMRCLIDPLNSGQASAWLDELVLSEDGAEFSTPGAHERLP